MTKALTLHQPWASLVALGIKSIETRSWAPPKALIGERLLVHAGRRNPFVKGPDQVGDFVVGTDGAPYVRKVRGGLTVANGLGYPVPLPLGAIVASCILADVVPMGGPTESRDDRWLEVVPEDGSGDRWEGRLLLVERTTHEWTEVTDQRPYGDFAPGRWAWLLEDVKPTTERCPACWGTGWITVDRPKVLWCCQTCTPGGTFGPGYGKCEPIPAKGHQRIWEWTP